MRGKQGWTYYRRDLSLQLRVLTERLGGLGHPFDAGDRNRTLSSYGSVLRIIRNRLSHGGEFEVFDALNTADTVKTVLSHIGDSDGARRAEEIRATLLRDLLEDMDASTAEGGIDPLPGDQTTESSNADEEGTVADGIYGAVDWESWIPVVVGEQDDLNSLRTTRVKENVRSLIEDIADAEGPVHQERVARLVGLAFGFSRLTQPRVRKIVGQIHRASVEVDEYGFVWPTGVDHSTWLIHRTNEGKGRLFEKVSPLEIANAIVAVRKDSPNLSASEQQCRVLAQFGRRRSSKAAKAHFALGLACGKATGRL